MSSQHPLPPKKEVALALLERSSVHVHLDPRANGVVVPPWFKKLPQLVLQVGLNMPVPIPDLRLDEEGMSCTLSFNRAPFYCVVPWQSVYAMVGDDGRGMVWPDDVPPEVVHQARAREGGDAKKAASKRGGLADASAGSGGLGASGAGVSSDAGGGKLSKGETAKPRKVRKRRAPEERPLAPQGDNARGMLVAVPPVKRTVPQAVPPLASAPATSQAGAPSTPAAQRGPDQLPAPRPLDRKPNGKGPKRELPPYLRVVK